MTDNKFKYLPKEDSNSSNYSNASNNSDYSNISKSSNKSEVGVFNSFSYFFCSLFFYLSSTDLASYFMKNEDIIKNNFEEDKSEYEGFYLFLDALKNLKDKNIQKYKYSIQKFEEFFAQKDKKEQNEDRNVLEKKNIFIFRDILIDKIGKIETLQTNSNIVHEYKVLAKGSGKTEKEAIEQYEKNIKYLYENIKKFSDLFFNVVIKYDSKAKVYNICQKCHFFINIVPNDANIYTIENYFEKKEQEKIYSFGKILLLLFDTSKKDYKIKYEMEMKLKFYNGKTQNFSLDAIIYEKTDDNTYIIKKKIDNNDKGEVKMFNGNEIKQIYIDDLIIEEESNIIMLIFKKI